MFLGDNAPSVLDNTCISGYCELSMKLCKPRAASGGACGSGRSSQCPVGEYCQSRVCTATLTLNADCAGRNADACGPSAFCRVDHDVRSCTKTPAEGDACDVSSGLVCPNTGGL